MLQIFQEKFADIGYTVSMNSDIFFFISSIGFIILGILAAILLVYLIRAVRSFVNISEKIESSMETIGDATMELIDDLRDNIFFKMIFPAKKKQRKLK